MNRLESTRRDRILRAFFEGKDWDHNDEFLLKRRFVSESSKLLPGFPFVVDDEWEFEPGHTNEGRGDLIFTDGEGRFAVVELKYMDNNRSGPTARKKRTKDRGKVVEQAQDYALKLWRLHQHDTVVEAYSYTNENEMPVQHQTFG